jgi:predicted kinase
MKPIVYLLCGLTGSGKSTYSKQLQTEQHIPRFSLDEEYFAMMDNKRPERHDFEMERRAEEKILVQMKELLTDGQSLILDHGFWKKANREKYCQLIREYGGEPKLIYFKVSKEELLRRLAERNETAQIGTHIVTPEMLNTFYEWFEAPHGEGEEIVTA